MHACKVNHLEMPAFLFEEVHASVICLDLKLQCAFYLLATQAAGANRHTLRNAIDQDAYLLRVRSPGAARLAVRMADIVAINNALAANFTILSHTLSHLLQGYVTTNSRIIPPFPRKRNRIGCKKYACQEKVTFRCKKWADF